MEIEERLFLFFFFKFIATYETIFQNKQEEEDLIWYGYTASFSRYVDRGRTKVAKDLWAENAW